MTIFRGILVLFHYIIIFDVTLFTLCIVWHLLEQWGHYLGEVRKRHMLYTVLHRTTPDVQEQHKELYREVTPIKILARKMAILQTLERAYTSTPTEQPLGTTPP